jgi:hypothetical protein
LQTSLQQLGFFVKKPCRVWSIEMLQEQIEWHSKNVNFKDFSCLMCFILGEDNHVVYLVEGFVKLFEDCPDLIGKPKMFIVVPSSRTSFVLSESEQLNNLQHIPKHDTLIHYAIAEFGPAQWDKENGFYFLECLCFMMDYYAIEDNSYELVPLLEKVDQTALDCYSIKSRMFNALAKRVYLNPHNELFFKGKQKSVLKR